MRVSLEWLNDYLNVHDLGAEKVAETLTDLGLEVEQIERLTTLKGDIVVGSVKAAEPHPNADSLRVCSVDVGEAEPLKIVCGAPNARPGIKVVVAKIGAVLPGDFKIKKAKIRGEESSGMMCSAKELGLGDDHAGIIELPAGAPVGAAAPKLLGLDDTVLELKVTPNRADCLGVIGVARDLAAKLGRTLKEPLPEPARDPRLKTKGEVTVTIEDEQLCPRFVALRVEGVAAVPSPAWMSRRLTAAGMRPINLIVDATNYAMLEYGQPIHAYDERILAGKTLSVRAAKAGETLTTLDGQARKLQAGDLLICDGAKPVGLAGIMGGKDTEVSADTRAVVIEVASFARHRIRQTARRLALSTEASYRFERGTDVDALPRVARRVAELLSRAATELKAQGQDVPLPRVAADEVDQYPGETQKKVVAMRLPNARANLALASLTAAEVTRILGALEFELLDSTDERLLFEIPSFRVDVEREADLIEEVGRVLGYDRIPYQLPTMNIGPSPEDPFIEFQETARTVMAAQGFRETISFPFAALPAYAALGIGETHPLHPTLSLANPMAEQQGAMQTTLVPGLLAAVAANVRSGANGVRLFECGRGYFMAGLPGRDLAAHATWSDLGRIGRHLTRKARGEAARPVERHWLGAVLANPYEQQRWDGKEVKVGFFHGKAAVAALFRSVGAPTPEYRRILPADLPWLHPGASAALYVGKTFLGSVGELHPRAAEELDLASGAAPVVLEIDLEALFGQKGKGLAVEGDLTRYPAVTRDVALVAERAQTHGEIEAAIRAFKRKRHLTSWRLFDVYEGKAGASLPEGKKSLAYALSFQSTERTLTDQEVDAEMQALVAWLGESLRVSLRT